MNLKKLISLYFEMLRYRVAVLLLMFLFLGIAIHGKITTFSFNYILAALALLSSYVSATTINDIVDEKIDKINHPLGKGRPLVSGNAEKKDLYILNIITSILAIIFVIPIGYKAVIIMILSLTISYIYSIEPIKVSYRTHFAHMFLAIAYVLIPYCLGVFSIGSNLIEKDYICMTAFTILFFGRIILKDFRDRAGDKKYKKPTFLLKYGKDLTCLISTISILIGNIIILFFILFKFKIILILIIQIYFICIYIMAYRLWKGKTNEQEQIAIGIGAKMGNGMILTFIGLLALLEYNASINYQIFFVGSITLMFLVSFLFLIFKPDYVNISSSYRG